jgi:DNA-binding MarR family transcriptional regulator
MTLEKDLNQTKFRNEHQKATVNIIFTNNWIMERINRIFDASGITSQQYNILRILRGAGEPLSTSQIRQRMLDKMSDSSRIVDRLLLKGMVKKTECKSDKRLVDVIITPRGLKLLEKIDLHNARVDEIMMNLSAAEARNLNQLLDKIRDPDRFE